MKKKKFDTLSLEMGMHGSGMQPESIVWNIKVHMEI